MWKALTLGGLTVALLAVLAAVPIRAEKPAAKPDDTAVERTRDTVRLLDNVYKNAVVLITETYVHDEDDFPAGSAAVELFKRTAKDGSHQVRLIDVTGMPYDEGNVAADEFERAGVKQLKDGKDYYEEVVAVDGKSQLRAMTPIPVVLEKCAMCHPHYKDAKAGAAIGALSYMLPIK
jgi:hypothetical protein